MDDSRSRQGICSMRNKFVILRGLIARWLCLGLLFAAPFCHALDYDYRFNTTFSGAGPSGPGPWVDAFFHDTSSGSVSLIVSNNGLSGSEFISGLYLNLNTNFSATSLSFHFIGGSVSSCPIDILTGRDQFKADGDGKYDILFDFDTALGHRFAAGDYLEYQITGIPSLTALDFEYLSAPAGGAGPFLAAAHVQSIGANDLSGWIRPTELTRVFAVPEPSADALLGLGLVVYLRTRGRSRRRFQ
jgi:hypothetical protein